VTRGSGNIAENDARVPDVWVDQVTVRYTGDGPAVLDDVSLRIAAGARIAVIGASGAGKSTLLAAIAGAVPLAAGVVHGAGVGWPLVGGVFAGAHVFHATVRENVSLGREDVTDGDVRGALKAAGLDLDLDAVVGEDGAQVSGGQRQRLLLARALVRTPPVLLLDEPTEGLDAATADAVLDSALAAAGASTVVVVTHRYANLDRFAEIVRLEEGRRVAPDVADVGR
jgi:ATP-binding cassette subfamily C protein CydC